MSDETTSVKLSDQSVRGITPPDKGYSILWDSDVKGFGIRTTAKGAKSFILNYRNRGGRSRRMTIGSYPDWSVAAARAEAKTLKKEIDRGQDPMDEIHAERSAPTMRDLCGRYEEEALPKLRKKTQYETKRRLRVITSKFGTLKVQEVQHADVDRLHRSLAKTPIEANRMVSFLKRLFNLAIRWHMRDDNPATGLDMFHEERRERYLTGGERARLLIAMKDHAERGKIEAQTVRAFRLAMLTGARIGEVLSATWDQFDLDAGVWTKPSAHSRSQSVLRHDRQRSRGGPPLSPDGC